MISYYKRKSGKKIGMRLSLDKNMSYYELWRNGKSYTVFVKELQKVADEHFKSKEIMNPTTLAVTHINGRPTLKRGNYIIGSQHKETGLISMTTDNPVQHTTKEYAESEASRLAKLFTAKRFVILEVVGTASVADVIWE